jgi:hypothetical protein
LAPVVESRRGGLADFQFQALGSRAAVLIEVLDRPPACNGPSAAFSIENFK